MDRKEFNLKYVKVISGGNLHIVEKLTGEVVLTVELSPTGRVGESDAFDIFVLGTALIEQRKLAGETGEFKLRFKS